MALGEVKNAEWFKELDKETQAIALEQQKDCYTPPRNQAHALLNIFVATHCQEEWEEYVKENLSWAETGNEGGDIAWYKQQFSQPYFLKWMDGKLKPKEGKGTYEYVEGQLYPIPYIKINPPA